MTKVDLPNDEHVVRYVKPTMVKEDGTISPKEFVLRHERPDETGLSVNWLEIFGWDKSYQLKKVRRLSRLQLSKNGRFAEMNVGKIKKKVAEEMDSLRIIHNPLEAEGSYEADPSHAEITGLPAGDSDQATIIGYLIAECVLKLYPAIVHAE